MALTIDEFGRQLRDGRIRSTDVTEACLDRIAADNPRLNAFILVLADQARAQAREADRRLAAGEDCGPLHGVPISIKDLLDLRGSPTTAASRVRDGHVAERDSAVVARLRASGAVLIGKTNLHEFAFGTTNEDSAFGAARNPHDPDRSPGGSSGGSAASVAAGMALASIGTDTGGSIRIPAAACGTVGLKPTFGEVPIDGVVPLSRTFDHVGPLARTVTDAWLVYRALTDNDRHARKLGARPLAGVRVGIPRAYFCDLLERDVRARFDEAVARIRAAGAHVHDVDIHHATDVATVYQHISFGDAAAYHATMLEQRAEFYTKPVRLRLETARYVLAEDYARALTGREVLRREVDAALAEHDTLALPTLPIAAPPLGAETVRIDGRDQPVRALMLRLTQLFNMTGHPAVSIPCGRTSSGLPCGLQLVGRRGETDSLAAVAVSVERLL